MKLLVLGGYGQVGRAIGRAALGLGGVDLVVAGPDPARAAAAAAALAGAFPGARVAARRADAADPASLAEACAGADLVVLAAPVPERLGAVAAAAFAAGADLIDILLDPATPDVLAARQGEIAARGRVAITQAGFHPGLPALLLRHAAARRGGLARARVAMAMNARFEGPGSARELVRALGANDARLLEAGRWRRAGWRDMATVDFGPPFGRRACYPLRMREIEALRLEGLAACGVWAAGFNPVVDSFVLPAAMLAGWVRPGLAEAALSRLVRWGVDRFWRGAPGVVLRLDAEDAAGAPCTLQLAADDAVALTAEAVAACILQLRAGGLARPGLHLMGAALEPGPALAHLAARGVRIDETGFRSTVS